MKPVRLLLLAAVCPGLAACLAALLPITAAAVPVTFAFEARITEIDTTSTQNLFNQSFAVGDTVRGTYRFESSTPDTRPANTSWGNYEQAVKSFEFGLHGAGGSLLLPGPRGVGRGGDIRVFDNPDSYEVTVEMGYMTPAQWSAFQAQRSADVAKLVQYLRSHYTPEAAQVIGTVCTGPGFWCDFRGSLAVGGLVGGIPTGGAYVLKPTIQMPEFDFMDPFFVPGPPTNVALAGDGLPLTPPNIGLFSDPVFTLDVEQEGLLSDEWRLLRAELTSLTLISSSGSPDQLPATLTSLDMPLLEDYLDGQRLPVPEPSIPWLFAVGLPVVLATALRGLGRDPAPN